MKFLLVSVVLLVGSSLAVPVVRRVRRDILPGDPRYGTDYHHHHHHVHGDHHDHSHGQVQVSKATGNYVGSYLAPAPVYGPPGYQPGTPLGPQNTPVFAGTYQQPAQVHNHYHHVPAPTYGVPTQQEHHHYSGSQPSAPITTKVTPTVSQPIDSYGSPISTNVNHHHHHHHHETMQTVQQPTRSYLTPVIESKKPEATVNTKVLYDQPKVNNAYLEPTVRSPATSVPKLQFVPESRPVQKNQVTVETVPATLLHEYTTVVRDESVGEAPSGPFPSIPNFPASFPNFEVPQVPDFSTATQGFTDNFSNFGENYENFVSNFNTNGFNFPGFGTQTNEKVESTPVQSAPVVKQADEPVTDTQSVVVENHHHEHHELHQQHPHQEHQYQHQPQEHQHQQHQHQHQHQQHQHPQPTANKETQQLVDNNGGYVY
ncbi:LIM domain-containing protein A-like [Chelonus insularis]|uniref:LIM domain-containing protein A-like n=1 Tax=Chelonus insularis TaxID=460826 RepID=UPI00158BDF8A|nr:LIM domain-containing protein A-like [Chelonus insularis]